MDSPDFSINLFLHEKINSKGGKMDLYLVWLQEVAVLKSSLAAGINCRA